MSLSGGDRTGVKAVDRASEGQKMGGDLGPPGRGGGKGAGEVAFLGLCILVSRRSDRGKRDGSGIGGAENGR